MKTEVKFGDIWKLGNHHLLCGDSTEEAMVSELIGRKKVRLMLTDPPYGVSYTTFNRKDPKRKASKEDKKKALADIKIRNDHRTSWSRAFLLSNAQISYVWHPSAVPDVAMQALRDAMYNVRQSVVWAKNRATLSRSAYHWAHESCLYAVKQGETANWLGDRKQRTLWQEPVPEPKTRIHPTQKAVGLYLRPINNHTDPKEFVYDPFAGSGVVFVACEETGRRALGVEFEPEYCSRIINRYQEQTGKKAKLVKNIFEEAQASA
ncbi:MAG: site-specific DNA-methyltransferase [Oligoflexales bacterium]|nr:site-specific DNA-methyltransferase [Oligoflexales bacterium]